MDVKNFSEKDLKYDSNGLIPAITQDYETGEVLMLAYMNAEALHLTLETEKVHYFSRSRQKLWLKGETSGSYQIVQKIKYDCDGDSLLISIKQLGAACHTGNKSCFFRSLTDSEEVIASDMAGSDAMKILYDTIIERRDNPRLGSYTNYLFDKGLDKILKKVGEESAEVIIACKNRDRNEIISEAADFMFHISVALAYSGIKWDEIYHELKKRRK